MLLDILVFGVLILCLNKLTEKRMEIRRYIDEIDDFRGWKSEEAAYRNAGNLKRLKRNGYKGNIDLKNCYLGGVDMKKDGLLEYFKKHLAGINLVEGKLQNADLRGAKLMIADLEVANLESADLRSVMDLQLDQLLDVRSLYGAKLDSELEKLVKEKYPHLLERLEE